MSGKKKMRSKRDNLAESFGGPSLSPTAISGLTETILSQTISMQILAGVRQVIKQARDRNVTLDIEISIRDEAKP